VGLLRLRLRLGRICWNGWSGLLGMDRARQRGGDDASGHTR